VSEDNPIRVFVTHSFTETDDYLRVFEFLESVERFFYLNVSKPGSMPAGGGSKAMKEELTRQIIASETVIVPASLYFEQPKAVLFQMDVADTHNKPLIGIRPFGGVQETPPELFARFEKHVEWNAREIVDAIKLHARYEDTKRFETIDFP